MLAGNTPGWLFILASCAGGAGKLWVSHIHPRSNGLETWQAVRFGGDAAGEWLGATA